MCQCRMCGDCMTGHFQVVITERHVKNLCCPNCQEPNIDDVTKETIYLEFLAVQVVTLLLLFSDKQSVQLTFVTLETV